MCNMTYHRFIDTNYPSQTEQGGVRITHGHLIAYLKNIILNVVGAGRVMCR